MRENLCTIPINKILEENDGCPLCKMRDIIEGRMVDFTLGDSMMDPETRMQTNKLGFCEPHLKQLKKGKNRLALALMLRTHIEEIEKTVLADGLFESAKKSLAKAKEFERSCFVCDGIERNMKHLLSTFCKSYNTYSSFRREFASQQYICLPHYTRLIECIDDIDKPLRKQFFADCRTLAENYLGSLKDGLDSFAKMFDYRSDSNSPEFADAKDAIERANYWLFSHEID